MLILEIEWLLGVCFAARSPADATPDWPPQPDRIFSALTASWGARGSCPEENAALQWLEGQQPPTIQAVPHEKRSSATVFVPPNDATAGDIRILPDRRRRQPRQFPTATLHGDGGAAHLRLAWQADPPPDCFAALCALARDTSYVGHSSSLVRCMFFDRELEGSAGLRAAVTTSAPYTGRLRELAALHARHVATGDASARPRCEPLVSPVQPTAPEIPKSVFGTRWIVLEFASSDRPDLRAAAVVGRGMRDALMSTWPAPIPEWLSGHTAEGSPSRDPHLAVVPLGDVGFWHSETARQSWHGLALVLPRAIEAAWMGADTPQAFENSRLLRAALDRLTLAIPDENLIVLRLGKFGALHLRPIPVPEASAHESLHTARYLEARRIWSTVTPIALDRHTKSTDPRQEAAEIIAESCTRVGLPPADEVHVHKHAAIAGSPSARPPGGAPHWTGWARSGSLANRQLTHATLRFKDPVAGPVMPREDEWARSPVQPTILCTTVDQLGSRLLFRGYGVSQSMAPIHAGLLGEDALLLLDEAHLSKPFQQTLDHVRQRRSPSTELARPWAICSLTATPQNAREDVFRLSDAEKAEPTIATRLAAAKMAELELCKDQVGSADHVAAFVNAAMRISQQCIRSAPVIAIIVNRVALARSVLETLLANDQDAILLTGRVRPVERSLLLDKYEARLTSPVGATESQAVPEPATRPLFVVATQCIEAGADFDFDAMVTQIAPLDALRQRFGRLNRLGLRDRAPAVIIAARNEIARGNDDPVYQGTLRETWAWLSARAEPISGNGPPAIGVSPRDFDALVAGDAAGAAKCVVSTKDAPVLRSADVAFLAMTNPRPQPDPYLPLFLHGEPASEADVSIIWRADCEIIALPPNGVSATRAEQIAKAIVACQPPMPGEALRVPIWAAKAWLIGPNKEAASVTDAEGERDPRADNRYSSGRRALRWRGAEDEDTELILADGLRSGDLIIVPASYGGCDRFGWSPASTARVDDIADTAAVPYHARYFALRLHQALWQSEASIAWTDAWQRLQQYAVEDDKSGLVDVLRPMVRNIPTNLAELRLRIELPYDVDDDRPAGAILIAPHGIAVDGERRRTRRTASTEDDMAGCFADGSVSLSRHARDVVQQAEAFANSLGLSRKLAASVSFAARYHDIGKADPRFQQWLSGPDRPREVLAK